MKAIKVLTQNFSIFTIMLLIVGFSATSPLWALTVNDAITYQGRLTNSGGQALNGTYTMRFQIYNASVGGTLHWDSGNTSVTVQDGIFDVHLVITNDIFNGEELWIAQTIDGELLGPRQEFLPTPMAHTLRPGAIIKGTANAVPNNYMLDVQLSNNVFGFNRGAIAGQTTTGNAIYGLAPNGRAVYGQTEDGYAIYGFDGGSNSNQGYGGYFYSTNGIGVYGYSSANRTHPNIFAPGVYGQSNQGVGVYGRGDTSNSHSFYNEGGYFEGGNGIHARGTDSTGYGARIFSDNYRGMYVLGASGYYDAYFGGNTGISVSSVTTRDAAAQSLVVNAGDVVIEPGDLVAMVGVAESPENGQSMLAVAKVDATNRDAVIGVAKQAVSAEMFLDDDNSGSIGLEPVDGVIAPASYLVIVTSGLAPEVNLDSLAVLSDSQSGVETVDMAISTMKVGSRMAVSTAGDIVPSIGATGGISIGRVAGPVNSANGTIPLFLKID